MGGWCQAALLAPLLLLAACGTVRTDLVRVGTLGLTGRPDQGRPDQGRPGQGPLQEAEARLLRAVSDEELLEPARLESWQRWLGEQLGVDPQRVLVGAHPASFPLLVPEGIDLALAWELEQPLVLAAPGEQARVSLGWSFNAALLGDAAGLEPERLERLAVATLASHLVGVLREEQGWTFDADVERLLRGEPRASGEPAPAPASGD